MIVLESLWKYIFALSPGPVHETLMPVCRYTTCLSWLTLLAKCIAPISACMRVTAFREGKAFFLKMYSTSWPYLYVLQNHGLMNRSSRNQSPQKAQQISNRIQLSTKFYTSLLHTCFLNISVIRKENVCRLCALLEQILEVGHSCYAVAFLNKYAHVMIYLHISKKELYYLHNNKRIIKKDHKRMETKS